MMNIKNIGKHLTRNTLALTVAALTLLTSTVAAQDKGAERLMKLQRLNTVADVQTVEAGDTMVMSCPKCRDTWVTVVQQTGKAANPQEKKSALRHECPGCSTKIVTEGVGKQAQDKAIHTCKQCGSKDASCCVMKKGTGLTQGMEERKGQQH
jgi:hypothetical protein